MVASTSCPNVFADQQQLSLYVMSGVVGASLLCGFFRSDDDIRRMSLVMIMPLLDVTSDFLVIFAVTFYNYFIFGFVVLFFILPSLYFIYHLVETEKYPRVSRLPISGKSILWLRSSLENPYMPSVMGGNIVNGVIGSTPTFLMPFMWAFLLISQIIYIAAALCTAIINIPLQFLWLGFGCFLFQTSLWSINRLWKLWIYVWSGESILDHNDAMISVNESRLQTSLNYHLILETSFQIILQALNVGLLQSYPLLALISIIISVLFVVNYIVFLYWKPVKSKDGFAKKDLKLKERNLAGTPFTKTSVGVIDDAVRKIRSTLGGNLDRKRTMQSKKCWDMLMVISDRYPRLFRILAAEKILSAKDLLHITPQTRDRIVDCLPVGALRDHVMATLSNFCFDEAIAEKIDDIADDPDFMATDGKIRSASTASITKLYNGGMVRGVNPMHDVTFRDELDYDPEEKQSTVDGSWDEYDIDIDEMALADGKSHMSSFYGSSNIHVMDEDVSDMNNFSMHEIYNKDNEEIFGFGMNLDDLDLNLEDIYEKSVEEDDIESRKRDVSIALDNVYDEDKIDKDETERALSHHLSSDSVQLSHILDMYHAEADPNAPDLEMSMLDSDNGSDVSLGPQYTRGEM